MAYPLPVASLLAPFGQRILHPWMSRSTRVIAAAESVYPALLSHSRAPRLAYLHIPFCANHCLFCGFYRNKSDASAMRTYVDGLIEEIAQDGQREGSRNTPIHAVFFGGGTPSALSAEDLSRLLSALHAHLPLAPDCEITIEGRVTGFDEEKIDACLEGGANRFSIGIQSFDTALRRRMGRKATREEATKFLRTLVERERAAVVCDLIYGLPLQSDEIWRSDVALCNEIGLDGVDLYCLNVHAGSPLARSIDKGALPPPADHATAARRYQEGGEILDAAGWQRLSQAHWQRTPRERNRYNTATKAGADCLALGAGAGGMLAGHRFMQDSDTNNYLSCIGSGQKAIRAMLAPPPHYHACSTVMAALEDGSLDLAELDQIVEAGFASALVPLIEYWCAQGLSLHHQGQLTLTALGRYWHNNIAAQLFTLIGHYLDGPPASSSEWPAGGHPAGIARPLSSTSKPKAHPHEHLT
jgi:anaerobilin synthase